MRLFKRHYKPKILIFCGAGLSVESGLNTFIDSAQLWEQQKINEQTQMRLFDKNKEKVFDFYNARKKEILSLKPNAAHYAIANLQKEYGIQKVLVFSSNIDNLLEEAGCEHVQHIHGSILTLVCQACYEPWYIGKTPYDLNAQCPFCHQHNPKPDIHLFNQKHRSYQHFVEHFNSDGIVSHQKVIPPLKLIIGTSFNAISEKFFYPEKGRSILVEPHATHRPSFEKIIKKPATEGVIEAIKIIKKWY